MIIALGIVNVPANTRNNWCSYDAVVGNPRDVNTNVITKSIAKNTPINAMAAPQAIPISSLVGFTSPSLSSVSESVLPLNKPAMRKDAMTTHTNDAGSVNGEVEVFAISIILREESERPIGIPVLASDMRGRRMRATIMASPPLCRSESGSIGIYNATFSATGRNRQAPERRAAHNAPMLIMIMLKKAISPSGGTKSGGTKFSENKISNGTRAIKLIPHIRAMREMITNSCQRYAMRRNIGKSLLAIKKSANNTKGVTSIAPAKNEPITPSDGKNVEKSMIAKKEMQLRCYFCIVNLLSCSKIG
jgi:hypothetical protein